jgi:hypothetical protein
MAAPVVPTTLAITVPNAISAVLSTGVPRMLPVTKMPPATTYRANKRTMKPRYSPIKAWTSAAAATGTPNPAPNGSSASAAHPKVILP